MNFILIENYTSEKWLILSKMKNYQGLLRKYLSKARSNYTTFLLLGISLKICQQNTYLNIYSSKVYISITVLLYETHVIIRCTQIFAISWKYLAIINKRKVHMHCNIAMEISIVTLPK